MKDNFPKYVIAIAAGIIITLLGIILLKGFQGCNEAETKVTQVIYDTSVVTRYEKELKTDTVIKWYEKIVYKEVPAKEIRVQKVDSIFIERTKDFDVMLKVDKYGRDLKIFALNQNGLILKEYKYNVGNDFSATSANGNVFVKTKKFYWTGLDLNTEAYLDVGNIGELKTIYERFDYRLSIETGLSYFDIASLKLGVERDFGTGNNSVKLKSTFKILQ